MYQFPLSFNLLLYVSSGYSESDKQYLQAITKEGRQHFPPSTSDYYESRDSLRVKVSNWAHSNSINWRKQHNVTERDRNMQSLLTIPRSETRCQSSRTQDSLLLLILFMELFQKLSTLILDHNKYILGGVFHPKANLSPWSWHLVNILRVIELQRSSW
jgi:hypothetical protein